MTKGYVYILANPSMPGLVKIGKTVRCPQQRAAELQQTGVPTPFTVCHSVFSPDCGALEASVHRALASRRVSTAREFFACEAREAGIALLEAHDEQVGFWLSEYLPDHVAVHSEYHLCGGMVARAAAGLGIPPAQVVDAINELMPEEIAPSAARVTARIERRADTTGGGHVAH
jgi:hypothetical protein